MHDRGGFSYILPAYGWVSPYYLGNPDWGYDDSSGQSGAALESPIAPQDQAQDLPPYPQAPYPSNPGVSSPAPAPAAEEAVTLIYKDGRQPEQIHNYLLTKDTLFVADQHRRAIPTDQLDLDATERVNHDLGVDFEIPNTLK